MKLLSFPPYCFSKPARLVWDFENVTRSDLQAEAAEEPTTPEAAPPTGVETPDQSEQAVKENTKAAQQEAKGNVDDAEKKVLDGIRLDLPADLRELGKGLLATFELFAELRKTGDIDGMWDALEIGLLNHENPADVLEKAKGQYAGRMTGLPLDQLLTVMASPEGELGNQLFGEGSYFRSEIPKQALLVLSGKERLGVRVDQVEKPEENKTVFTFEGKYLATVVEKGEETELRIKEDINGSYQDLRVEKSLMEEGEGQAPVANLLDQDGDPYTAHLPSGMDLELFLKEHFNPSYLEALNPRQAPEAAAAEVSEEKGK